MTEEGVAFSQRVKMLFVMALEMSLRTTASLMLGLSGRLTFDPDRTSIKRPPGLRLMSFIRFAYSAKSFDKVFEPIYADFWQEYTEALNARPLTAWDRLHAKWIRARFYISIWSAAGGFGLAKIAKKIWTYFEQLA